MSTPLSNPFLNLLYNIHVGQTSLPDPPFKLIIPFNISQFDIVKMNLITSSKEEFDKFVEECAEQFISIHANLSVGSVHLNPCVWTQFAIKTIEQGISSQSDQLIFPNGCCSKELECPINMYYRIVLSNLLIQNSQNDTL